MSAFPFAGRLHPLSLPPALFYRVRVDLHGTFPISSAGNQWVVVPIDYSAHYVETKALPAAALTEVAQFLLNHVILNHEPHGNLSPTEAEFF